MGSLNKRSMRAGFAVMELLIILAILMLLAVIGVPQYQAYKAEMKLSSTKSLHSQTMKLISEEIKKCSNGSANILENTTQQISCSEKIEKIAGAFVAYGNEKNKNPYDSSVPAYSVVTSDANGVTSIVGKGTIITVITTWEGGNQTATLTKE